VWYLQVMAVGFTGAGAEDTACAKVNNSSTRTTSWTITTATNLLLSNEAIVSELNFIQPQTNTAPTVTNGTRLDQAAGSVDNWTVYTIGGTAGSTLTQNGTTNDSESWQMNILCLKPAPIGACSHTLTLYGIGC
jgi:hypothetical protein